METKRASSSRHKEWRRLAKKERRRRIRRKAAQERDADDLRLRATLERSANYTNWLAEQEKQEKEREALEQREHDEKEKLWLEEEVRAQKEWRVHQERRVKARQEKLQQEEIIRKEFEAKQEALRKKKEENKRLYEEEIKRHEDVQKQIDDYIDNGTKTPEALRVVSESQSGKELCPFFTKTGACRFGESCSRNHRRVALSKVILIPGFYSHFSLEKNSAEYDTDISLEFESSETRHHFRDFYDEVVPELESFGRIKTLKYCCNTEIHLRGNLYVEYRYERDAARAWRKLKGRFWAGRQLNCEFVNLKSWRDAVCGMNKCPKGRACNFLHTFRNPNDEYDVRSPPRWAKKKDDREGSTSRRSEQRSTSKWDDFDRASTDESRNWRWSESPEPGLNPRTKSDKTRRSSENRSERRNIEDRSERRNFEDRGERRNIEDRSERRNIEDRGERRNFEDRGDRRNIEDRGERRNIEDRGERRNIEDRSERRNIEDRSERRNTEDRGERRNIEDKSERRNIEDRGEPRNVEDRSERQRCSRSERRRDDESDRSSSRSSVNDFDPQKRKNSLAKSRKTEDNYVEESDTKYEEYSSRKRVKKSRKRRADDENEDNEEIKQIDASARKWKKSKTGKRKSTESNHPSPKKNPGGKSKGRTIPEKQESDENVDTNSNKSCANAKKLEAKDEEIINRSHKARWDEIEGDSTDDKDVRPNKSNIVKNDSKKKHNLSTDENAWDTTDSESEEKWKERSP